MPQSELPVLYRLQPMLAKVSLKGTAMTVTQATVATSTHRPRDDPAAHDKALRKAAQALESDFLFEMLKSAGLGESRQSFGGGAGEEQFSTFLLHARADAMVEHGGIGLAEHLYKAMKGHIDAKP